MMGYGGFGGMGWGGMVGMVLLWAVLIGLVVWAVTRLLPTRPNGGGMQPWPETPEEILDRRFARRQGRQAYPDAHRTRQGRACAVVGQARIARARSLRR